jgi:hypothetical protein
MLHVLLLLLLLLQVCLSLNQARRGGALSGQARLPCLGTVVAATAVAKKASRDKEHQRTHMTPSCQAQ